VAVPPRGRIPGRFLGSARATNLLIKQQFSNLNQQFQRQLANLNQHCEPRAKQGVTPPQFIRETNDAYEERRFEARLCGHGSGQATRDCKQGREGQSRRRTQEQLQPLKRSFISVACAPGASAPPASGACFSQPQRAADIGVDRTWLTGRTSTTATRAARSSRSSPCTPRFSSRCCTSRGGSIWRTRKAC
jgi:hypothetical protein